MLVLGSGPNSEWWREKGATTLDIDTSVGADIVADANKLAFINEIQERGSYNTILTEYITRDPKGKDGVDMCRLIPQAYELLVDGGELVMLSATIEGSDPKYSGVGSNTKEMLDLLVDADFKKVSFWRGDLTTTIHKGRRLGDKVIASEFSSEAGGVYYATK